MAVALFLPWQTKLIWQGASSNYWEISIFIGALLVCLFIFALLPSGLLSLPNFLKENYLLRYASGALMVTALISVFFSSAPLLSAYHLILLVIAVLFFYFLRQCPPTWRRYFLIIILAGLSVQAVLGIIQFLTQTTFASSILGIASHYASDLGTAVIETANGRWLRAYGASDHPNVFGGVMALAALISLYLFKQEKKRSFQVALTLIYFLFLTAVLASFSRAAGLALALGLIIFLIEQRHSLFKRPPLLLIIIFFSFLITLLFTWQYQELIWSRAQINSRLEVISLNERQVFNQRAWLDFKQQPLLGTGLGASTFFDYQHDLNNDLVKPVWQYQPAHNYWLLAATESGILFVIALSFVWFFIYKKSRQRQWLGLFVALLFLTLFDHWLFSLPLSSLWFFSLLALI